MPPQFTQCGEMLTKAKLAALLVISNAVYSVVQTLFFNELVCRKGKNNLQPPLEILYFLQLVCLHLKGNVRRIVHSSLFKNLSLWTSWGLTCLHSKSRSASMNYSLQMNSRNACLF